MGNFSKILKLAGILALISLPILLFTKRKKSKQEIETEEDENNIFAEELYEKDR